MPDKTDDMAEQAAVQLTIEWDYKIAQVSSLKLQDRLIIAEMRALHCQFFYMQSWPETSKTRVKNSVVDFNYTVHGPKAHPRAT